MHSFAAPPLRAALIALALLGAVLLAQPRPARAIDNKGAFWLGYMSTWWLHPNWALWFDAHYNTRAFAVLRGGVTYAFDAGPRVTAGFAYLRLDTSEGYLDRNEYRPWAQVVLPWRFAENWRFSHRLRTDFRWRENVEGGRVVSGFDFTFRARWQNVLTYDLPPIRLGKPFLQVASEVLVDFAKEESAALLDQNRASGFVGLNLGDVTVRVGYMNRWLAGPRVHEHSGIIWFTHSIDLRKKRRKDTPEVPEYGGP